MPCIWTKDGLYTAVPYASEADLEATILEVQKELFGLNRIYLDVKRKIGGKTGPRNIPDGYLIDLNGSKPRLFVVENELAAHDPLRHIAIQILQFSLSFQAEPRAIKRILFAALNDLPAAKAQVEAYAAISGFRNLDDLLDWLVFDSPFAALVIIDEMPEDLENILSEKFRFGVEVLQVTRYKNAEGSCFYHFKPFLADLVRTTTETTPLGVNDLIPTVVVSTADIDTVVVPAREEGFREVFLGENRWYAVRIHGSMRPQIKYIAVYQVAPESAITHIAPVKSIEPWKDTGKLVINFAEPAKSISPPIPMLQKGRVKTFQNLRYTTKSRLERAKSLDEIW